MASVRGPLSPHLTVYKWQITMLLSIIHRATGVFLSLGALLLAYWLLAVASGPETYAVVAGHLGAWYGRLLLGLFTVSVYFHLCNGIRHLFWDAGYGFDISTSNKSAWAVVVATVILSLLTFVAGGVL